MLTIWELTVLLYSCLACIFTCQTLQFPNLSLVSSMNKTIISNFTEIVRYQIICTSSAFELYGDGSLIYTRMAEGLQYQQSYFDKNNPTSFFSNQSLVDFANQPYIPNDVHFLLINGKILTFDSYNKIEKNRLNVTEIGVSVGSLVEATNESFYVVNPSNANQSAFIWRTIREDKLNLTRVIPIAQQQGRNITNISTIPSNNSITLNDLRMNKTLKYSTNITGSKLNAKVCQKYHQSADFLAVWNEIAQLEVWKCDFWECKLLWNNKNLFMNNSTIELNWIYEHDCTMIYIKAIDTHFAVAYYVDYGQIFRNYTLSNQILDFKSAGWNPYGYSALLFANGSFIYVSQLENYTFLYEYKNFGNVTPLSRYLVSGYRRSILINNENSIQIWKLTCPSMKFFDFSKGTCLNCSQTCNGCSESSGYCIQCINGYQLNPNNPQICRLIIVINPPISSPPSISNGSNTNSTNLTQNSPQTNQTQNSSQTNQTQNSSQTNQTQNSSQTNQTQNSSETNQTQNSSQTNQTQNSSQTNQTQNSSQTNQTQNSSSQGQNLTTKTQNTTNHHHHLKYGSIQVYEFTIAQIALDGFQSIGSIVKYIFITLQIAPLAWLFLKFMNFWNISTFYIFLNVNMPEYLRMILKLIYDKINSSILNLENIVSQIYPLEQRLPQVSEQYSISSSFLLMNLENLIFFTFSMIIAAIAVMLLKNLDEENYLKKRFVSFFDFKETFANRYISIASNFFLPLKLICKKINILSFHQVPNLLLHIFFIGFSLVFPFMIFNKEIKASKLLKSKVLTKQNMNEHSLKKERKAYKMMQWIYLSNGSTLFPLICLLEIPSSVFYVFGIVYFSIGIRLAWKSQAFRINEIILSLYPMVFHLCFIMIAVFENYSISLKHHASMACTIVIFLAAIHELLTVIIRVIIFFFIELYKILRQVKDKELENIQGKEKEHSIFQNLRTIKFNLNDKEKNTDKIVKKIKLKKKKTNFRNQFKLQQIQKPQPEKFEEAISEEITLQKKKKNQLIKAKEFTQLIQIKSQYSGLKQGVRSEFDCVERLAKPEKKIRKIKLKKTQAQRAGFEAQTTCDQKQMLSG